IEIRQGSNSLLQPVNLCFDKFKIFHQFAQHQAVMVRDASAQNETKLGNFAAQAGLSFLRQQVRIHSASNNRFDHVASTGAENIGSYSVELDAGIFEHFMDAVMNPVALFSELHPVTG